MKRGHYEEDRFQSELKKLMKYVMRHRDISIIIAAIIVIGGGYLIYSSSRGDRVNPEADIIHTQAIGMISMGRMQEAENMLLDLTSRYKNSRSGKIGVYYLGVVYYSIGRFDESLEKFNEFLSFAGRDYLLAPSAHYGAACAAEGIKDYEQAKSHYKKILSDEDSPFYFPATLSYARVTGLLGDEDEAIDLLEELLDKQPPAEIAIDAQFYIGYFSD